jgi:hypothetical protein
MVELYKTKLEGFVKEHPKLVAGILLFGIVNAQTIHYVYDHTVFYWGSAWHRYWGTCEDGRQPAVDTRMLPLDGQQFGNIGWEYRDCKQEGTMSAVDYFISEGINNLQNIIP